MLIWFLTVLGSGYRQARRIVIFVVGLSVLIIGVAMLVLPGPAVVVIPLGLAILAVEFAWARRWLRAARERAEQVRGRVFNRGDHSADSVASSKSDSAAVSEPAEDSHRPPQSE